MPINTGPVQLYINTYQYVLIQVITNYQIPINYCLSINIPSSYIIQGSAYAVLSTVTNNFLIYNYTADTIYISNFGALPGGTVFSVSLKVKFLIQTFFISAKIDSISNINAVNPLYYGTSTLLTAQTPSSLMTSFTSSGN